MADVQPLRALHYDTGKAGPLDRLTAPPYDVIDDAARAELAARSPFNVVHVDLPEGESPYEAAGNLFEHWQLSGAVVQDAEPALWALTQDYELPDGARRTRTGFFCRVRISEYGAGLIRPHERTHPAAKEDRLRLMRATRANLSPIFALYPDENGSVPSVFAEVLRKQPWGQITDGDGTVHRLWRVPDPDVIAKVQDTLAGGELLIADGHHRYETARTYAEEVGGEGPHRYVLMCLVSLSDPGLTILPTHRLVRGIDPAQRERLRRVLEQSFRSRTVGLDEVVPEPGVDGGAPVYGYLDAGTDEALRIELASPAAAADALAGYPSTYRQLDTAVLEKLMLEQALGLTEEDISHERGLGYARDATEALERVRSGEYDIAFLLRPTPVEQVKAVAEAGETMPPKSTYFYPKILTGLLFNSLE